MLLNTSRSKILPLAFLTLTFVCFKSLTSPIAAGQQWPKLTCDSSIKLDGELMADLPFDVSEYKNLNEAENREQGYFRSMAFLFASQIGSFEDASTGSRIGIKDMPPKIWVC